MRIRSKSKKALIEYRQAKQELERISRRDKCETDAYLAANKRVIELEKDISIFRR